MVVFPVLFINIFSGCLKHEKQFGGSSLGTRCQFPAFFIPALSFPTLVAGFHVVYSSSD